MADDKTKDKADDKAPAPIHGDDLQSLRERVARLEGQLAERHAAAAPEAKAAPSGPKYLVTYPNWSHLPAGSTVHESQLGGPENAARLVAAGHVTPSRDGDGPAA